MYLVILTGPALRRWNCALTTAYGQSGAGLSVRLGLAPASQAEPSLSLLTYFLSLPSSLVRKKKMFISFALYLLLCLLFTILQGILFDCQIELSGWEEILLVWASFILQGGSVSTQKAELKPMNDISADLELHLSLAWDVESFPCWRYLGKSEMTMCQGYTCVNGD